MWMERGLSENTLASYRNDLVKLLQWLEDNHYKCASISAMGLNEFQAYLVDKEYKQTSRARMLSALRRFFQYLHREKFVEMIPQHYLLALNYLNAYQKI